MLDMASELELGYPAIYSSDPAADMPLAMLTIQCSHLMHYALVLITILFDYILPHRRAQPQPLHTSILSGQGWVDELLLGHPDQISHLLDVQKEAFLEMIETMQSLGLKDSCWVTLEEQLVVFLYASVTGLTICHLTEQFQQSNDTISRCVLSVSTATAISWLEAGSQAAATAWLPVSSQLIAVAVETLSTHLDIVSLDC